ncbi:response regulator transcription factor [Campylobacter concisus]|uniref:response regulator transcription factor n=1 Tax=Campylobacter concisus TaxID=199 RepID=UPI000D32500A|nr:response regulator transcription factor [Campylobacter concisus]
MQEYDILDVLSNKKVLCLEDEEAILRNICASLELFFAEVKGVTDGFDALELAIGGAYDALVLDISVPNIDGLEIAKKVRAINQKIPIVILSSHVEQEYLWRAVELKITRYLAKPYDKKSFIKALEDVAFELVGRTPTIRLNDELEYDFGKKALYVNGEISHLSKSESKLLEYFLNNKNKTITYEQIFDYIWDYEQPTKEAIKTIVKELRRKLGKDVIKNLYGVGYLCEI